jgi:hypothetical protein
MGLRTKYEIESGGNTVPYPALFDSIRQNHGFRDLKGNPQAAENVPEASTSRALQRLLATVAQLNCSIFSPSLLYGVVCAGWPIFLLPEPRSDTGTNSSLRRRGTCQNCVSGDRELV